MRTLNELEMQQVSGGFFVKLLIAKKILSIFGSHKPKHPAPPKPEPKPAPKCEPKPAPKCETKCC